MRRALSIVSLALFAAGVSLAIDLQGVITDWNCTQDMVRHGRERILKQRRSCSLAKDYHRSGYGLITDDKKFYRIDPATNDRVLELLANSPDKDNLKVVVSGDLQGNTIKINTISIL
ncbi:MAG TPA: hypothetical protein VFA65_18600 [Bryobacteraceae bacterium]|nr:hypothetical protein [Bryobacteraceae bacterium]